MSLITTLALKRLWEDAQLHPEWATTRLWEHIFNRIVFSGDPWLVSSQQPPTHKQGDLRRVDLIVEQMNPSANTVTTLLFVEAKRANASPGDIAEVEMQAYAAACAYAVDLGSTDPIWTMTCVGSLARLWIFDWGEDFLVPYFPETHGAAERSEYVEISERGSNLLRALNYVKKHPRPPNHLIGKASPRPTDITLPPGWHADEVVMRDAQHEQQTRYGSATGGAYEAEMTDASQQELAESQQGVYSSASWPSTALQEGDMREFGHEGLPETSYVMQEPDYYGEQSTEAQNIETWSKVNLRKVSHITKRDEYVFTINNSTNRSTDRDEWKETEYRGKRAWYYNYKGIRYYTRAKPGTNL